MEQNIPDRSVSKSKVARGQGTLCVGEPEMSVDQSTVSKVICGLVKPKVGKDRFCGAFSTGLFFIP